MGGVCEEIFEGLVYHQEASIRKERVEASNLCSRTLIFNFFYFIVLLSKTFRPFLLSGLSVLLSFSFF
jgi:hypothetical protein